MKPGGARPPGLVLPVPSIAAVGLRVARIAIALVHVFLVRLITLTTLVGRAALVLLRVAILPSAALARLVRALIALALLIAAYGAA